MRDLPLNALRAFAAVYAHGGIRAAARELGVAHSSIHRHLAELNAWVGVPLFAETAGRRGLAFTAQGETLGKAALAGLGDIAAAVAALREAKPARAVTLSTTPSFAARWLLPRLPSFEQRHPGIEVSVVVNQKLDDLDAGGIDLAVRMGAGPWPGTRSEPLMDDALYPVTSPALLAHARRPPDLSRARLLHDRDPQASWEAWRRVHGPATLDVRRGPRFASSDLLLRAAQQGQGVALARHRLAADDVATGTLLRPFGDRRIDLGVSYWLVQSPRQGTRAATAALIDWLKREAAAQPSAAARPAAAPMRGRRA